jgi:DNA polymerase delta subunit 1
MGLNIAGIGEKVFQTFESNILFPLRFMIDVKMQGMSWLEISAGKYVNAAEKISTCQIEVHLTYDAITAHAPDGEWMKIAPLRILSMGPFCFALLRLFTCSLSNENGYRY